MNDNWPKLLMLINDTDNGSFRVFVEIADSSNTEQLLLLDLEDADATELGKSFLEFLRYSTAENEEDKLGYIQQPALLSQDEDSKPKVMLYDYDEPIGQLAFLQSVSNLNLPRFSFKTNQLDEIRGIIVTFGQGSDIVTMYKRKVSSWIYKRSRFMLMPMNERLTRVTQDILTVDKKFEFFLYGGELYILNLKALESHFGFKEYRKKEAIKVFSSIDKNYFKDIVKTKELISKYADVAKKLTQLKGSPVLSVPKAQVLAFIKKKKGLDLKIVHGKIISTKTKAGFLRFLKVLNEDYLHSELTHKDYDSTVKKTITLE